MYFDNLFNNYFPFRNSCYPFRPQTSQQTPYQEDFRNPNIMRQKILSEKSNYQCFDCGRQINELNYFDLKNGIFFCYNCALQHQKYPKEISEVVTGNIRTLDQRYLMPLYLGGNNNLVEFIRNNFPLLEKKGRKNIYTSRALDYYRKLIFAKINNEIEPIKPSILDGYNSIYSEKPINPSRKYNNNYGNNMNIEPAIINNQEKNEDNDIEMEDENRSSNNNESDVNTSQDSGNEEKNKKGNINKNEIKKKKLNLNLNNGNKIKIEKRQKNEIYERCLTVNQLGNLNMYPDAKTIDDMDC